MTNNDLGVHGDSGKHLKTTHGAGLDLADLNQIGRFEPG